MSDLAELHDELRTVARGLLGRSGEPGWDELAGAGWLGLDVPEALGGSGATFAELAVVLDELGRAVAPGHYLGTAVLGVGALLAVAPTPARDDLLRRAASGQARLAVALAVRGDIAAAPPAFRVERTGSGPTVAGGAELVVDLPAADHLLLLARDGDRPVVVHAEATAVDVVERPVLDETRRVGDLVVHDLPVDDAAIWPLLGDGQRLADRAALAVACDSVGLAGAMLDATVGYVAEREQFGRPVGSFQAVKHQCADALVQLTVARRLVAVAVEALVADDPDAGLAVARAKAFATETGVAVAGTALQLHGGIGYTWERGIHRYLKRAVLDRALFGPPREHRRRLAARWRDGDAQTAMVAGSAGSKS